MPNGELFEFPKPNYTDEDMARFRQEAWEWALDEQKRYFPDAPLTRMKGLGRRPYKYGSHLSFFEDPENPGNAIYRVFWPDDNKVLYRRLYNLEELKKDHPELTEVYLLSGVYAYLKTVKPAVCKAVFNG